MKVLCSVLGGEPRVAGPLPGQVPLRVEGAGDGLRDGGRGGGGQGEARGPGGRHHQQQGRVLETGHSGDIHPGGYN